MFNNFMPRENRLDRLFLDDYDELGQRKLPMTD